MSKRIEAKVNCPACSTQYNFTLYRTIWGEYPENRELVMSNKINVASCPNCNQNTNLLYPFMYTNAPQQFAVWWEPEFDPKIGKDSEGYARLMGAESYLATAPRIKDWEEFKSTILKFESGELKAKGFKINEDAGEKLRHLLKHPKEPTKAKDLTTIIVKLLLALLFMLCLLDLSYSYYQIIRFIGLIGFGILAYQANLIKQKQMTIIFISLALLFQPFFKISLGRQLWNIVDVVVSIFLIASIFIERRRK